MNPLSVAITGGAGYESPPGGALGAGIAGGTDLASAYLQYRWARSEAQRNRDWQERMSSTAYQRSVADMRAAGINPMLLAGHVSPAGVGSGGQASITGPQGVAASAMRAWQQKLEMRRLAAEAQLAERSSERQSREAALLAQTLETERHHTTSARAEATLAENTRRAMEGEFGKLAPYIDKSMEWVRGAASVARDFAVGGSAAFSAKRLGALLRSGRFGPRPRHWVSGKP